MYYNHYTKSQMLMYDANIMTCCVARRYFAALIISIPDEKIAKRD